MLIFVCSRKQASFSGKVTRSNENEYEEGIGGIPIGSMLTKHPCPDKGFEQDGYPGIETEFQ